MKKKKGEIGKIAITLISVFVMFILTIINSNISKDMNKRDTLDSIARKYLLIIETEGYLTTIKETEMINELKAEGLINISLTGTTKSIVEYGNPVYLSIRGNVKVTDYDVKIIFGIKETEKETVYTYKLRSTAKH